jgi:hypothetical protein
MPLIGRETGFLNEFSSRTIHHGFPGIKGSGWNFPDILSQGVTILLEQDDMGGIDHGYDCGCARMLDKFHIRRNPVV